VRLRVLSLSTTHPEDWGRRFQEMSAEAGEMYARVLRRYNELLLRVANGELQPEAVQREFREYLQEQSVTSTRELIELTVGLLAGLLHIEAKYREALLDGLLPPDGPIPPPPPASSIDLTNWFQVLSKYAAEQSARGIARQQQLVERIASRQITSEQMQQQGQRYLASNAPRFLGEVMDLGLTYVSELQRSSSKLAEGLYDHVLGPAAESFAPERPLIADLRGPSGSVVTTEIVVENGRADAANVSCLLSEFSPRAGGRSFLGGAEITPARFTLAPGESRDVVLSVPLDRNLFTPGVDYFGLLRISGARDQDMVVQHNAHAEPLPPEPAKPPAKKKKRASASA
jgi:hypothetical protein